MTWTPTAADRPIRRNKLRSSEDWWRGCRGDVLRQTVPGITSGSDWKCAVSDGEKARAMHRGPRHARMPGSTDGQSVVMTQRLIADVDGHSYQSDNSPSRWKHTRWNGRKAAASTSSISLRRIVVQSIRCVVLLLLTTDAPVVCVCLLVTNVGPTKSN